MPEKSQAEWSVLGGLLNLYSENMDHFSGGGRKLPQAQDGPQILPGSFVQAFIYPRGQVCGARGETLGESRGSELQTVPTRQLHSPMKVVGSLAFSDTLAWHMKVHSPPHATKETTGYEHITFFSIYS